MGLNAYRNEAGDFLRALSDADRSVSGILDMVEREVASLRAAVGDAPRLRHKVYDVLFLLFELGSVAGFDLDEEWEVSRPRLYAKYLGGRTPQEILRDPGTGPTPGGGGNAT
jgi:hypothetical protein